jgi:superfamily II DNA or RNA helicase
MNEMPENKPAKAKPKTKSKTKTKPIPIPKEKKTRKTRKSKVEEQLPPKEEIVLPKEPKEDVLPKEEDVLPKEDNNEFYEKEAVIEEKMDQNKCSDPNNYYSSQCNALLLEKEDLESQKFEETPDSNLFLYPHLNDPNFNVKIAEKKEFSDTRYDGTIYNGQIVDGKKYGIKEHAEKLFNADFSLQPHQAFVKNFLSFQTPYNSLLLYHGLGSGKTCSAIGVCEETREYLKQIGKSKRIIIVASPNVLDNFRTQLFNESKLKEVNGIWTAGGCIGNKILTELNPTNLKGLSKERVIAQVKNLINSSYLFFGYIEFARYIERVAQGNNVNNIRKKIQNEFNERLIVIDEVHNIRMSDDNENKKVAEKLEELVTNAANMRLLLLSATPMYNNCKEIVWLLNLMNINDRRGIINVKTIFDKDGNFKKDGKDLLIRKARGYISFVRGDNPYMFPFRMFPRDFVQDELYKNVADNYPSIQMNGKEIDAKEKPDNLDLYVTNIGEYQRMGYFLIMDNLKKQKNIMITRRGERKMPSFHDLLSISYVLLQTPLQSLNIVYPMDGLDKIFAKINPDEFYKQSDDGKQSDMDEDDQNDSVNDSEDDSTNPNESSSVNDSSEEGAPIDTSKEDSDQPMVGGAKTTNYDILTGTNGLKRIMKYNPIEKTGYQYINTPFGHIFKPDQIGKYSSKIKTICDCILRKDSANKIVVSNGIILIYSQYIDGGLIPMALALEELGFTRYGSKGSLFESSSDRHPIDVLTMTPITRKKGDHKPAKYAMITGDGNISPDNNDIVKTITNINNKDGHQIKVLLISKAGSEGIDLKFIRQIHVMEPWYNMNRIEQIIGRGVRSGSHRDLPFEERNVEIYLHGTNLPSFERIESSDLYVYRTAHNKAKQIGEVTRVLKENSVDCIINHDQINFTQTNFTEPVVQHLSTGKTIAEYQVGDVDYSAHCDYKECKYTCSDVEKKGPKILNTYSEKFMLVNAEHIIQIIKMLMLERHFYKKDTLLNEINRLKHYPIEQINMALTQLIDNKEPIVDKYSHSGTLVNIDEYYIFQPDELTNKKVGVFERMVPLELKDEAIHLDLRENILLKPEIANQIIGKRNLVDMQSDQDDDETDNSRGKTIMTEMTTKYSTAVNYAKIAKVERGDKDWYKYCGIAIRTLTDKRIINIDIISYLLVEHLVDELMYEDKLSLLNYFYKSGKINENEKSFEYRVYNRLTYKTVSFNGNTFMLLFDKNKQKKLIMLGEKKVWKLAEEYYQDNTKLDEAIKQTFLIEGSYSKIIGFIDYDKKDDSLIFKTKDTEAKRTSGARCDEAGKTTAIKRLNEILNDPDNVFDAENTKGKVQQELCIYQEFILRNNDKNEDLKYFMTFEEMCFHGLSKQK